jgi:hypothetical protein
MSQLEGKQAGWNWRWLASVAATAACTAVSLAQVPAAPPPAAPPSGVQPVGLQPQTPPAGAYGPAPVATPAAPAVDPVDYLLGLTNEAARSMQNIRDYSCVFVKQERIGDHLQPESVIALKVRQQPFSVAMRWAAPKDLAGQEVVYVAGRNNGNLRVHATGIKGAIGFVSIAPNDPRATAQSRHPITEAGVGNLILSLQQSWARERGLGRTQVRAAEYEYNHRKCTRVDVLHSNDAISRQFYCFRSVVYFDKETKLPVRIEAYDWPRRGGSPDGDLLECYSYVDFRFNSGIGDDVFNH